MRGPRLPDAAGPDRPQPTRWSGGSPRPPASETSSQDGGTGLDPALADLEAIGVVPDVDAGMAVDGAAVASALTEGGLPAMTFSAGVPCGLDAIRSAATAHPGAIVGASDVTDCARADAAVAAGARFLVGHRPDASLLAQARSLGIELVPECTSREDIARAAEHGCRVVRLDGDEDPLPRLASLAAELPDLRLWPVCASEPIALGTLLAVPHVLAVSGSWMVSSEHLSSGGWSAITAAARRAARAAHGFGVVHVGVSTAGDSDAAAVANRFASLFGFEPAVGASSIFASSGIEVMKGRSRGELGHIAIGTTDIARAIRYLERQGVALDAASIKHAPDGSLKAIYLADEVAGFAVHLMQTD